MKRAPAKRHPDLFEDDSPSIVVPSEGLVRLIRIMLMEIATTTSVSTAKREGGDDEDHA